MSITIIITIIISIIIVIVIIIIIIIIVPLGRAQALARPGAVASPQL